MSILLAQASEWTYLLGGICPRSLRNTPMCDKSTGVHGPWVDADGNLVKIFPGSVPRPRANEITAAALASWHPAIDHDGMNKITNHGSVTVTFQSQPSDDSAEYSLYGDDTTVSVYMAKEN